jgi:late competence protein required for DNA uptake (superfamily II DNA/RNA helicase)
VAVEFFAKFLNVIHKNRVNDKLTKIIKDNSFLDGNAEILMLFCHNISILCTAGQVFKAVGRRYLYIPLISKELDSAEYPHHSDI